MTRLNVIDRSGSSAAANGTRSSVGTAIPGFDARLAVVRLCLITGAAVGAGEAAGRRIALGRGRVAHARPSLLP